MHCKLGKSSMMSALLTTFICLTIFNLAVCYKVEGDIKYKCHICKLSAPGKK